MYECSIILTGVFHIGCLASVMLEHIMENNDSLYVSGDFNAHFLY